MDLRRTWAKMTSVQRVVLGAVVGVVVLAIAGAMLVGGYPAVNRLAEQGYGTLPYEPSVGGTAIGLSGGDFYADDSVGLSVRNISPPPAPGTPAGEDAEEYEVTDYGVRIGTRDLEGTCGTLAGLKAKDHVIFEYANERDLGCTYRFKVKRDRAQEIVATIKELDPRDFAESTQTITQVVADFTAEEEVLTKKRDAIEQTLQQAIASYDAIAAVATRANDAETLAKIIENKIRAIERLTQERIAVDQQLDRLARAKAEQLDRVEYVFFSVDVYEEKIFDGRDIADSWRAAARQAAREANAALQAATIGLIVLAFLIVRWGLTLLILLVVAKYGWRLARRIWNS